MTLLSAGIRPDTWTSTPLKHYHSEVRRAALIFGCFGFTEIELSCKVSDMAARTQKKGASVARHAPAVACSLMPCEPEE
jgi:hypothetical protein